MSEKQRALVALGLVLGNSKAALVYLTDPTESLDNALDGSNLSLLHKDFLSLLYLIYGSTTKLSLVLKPSSPSYKAALEPLRELSDRIASLPHCVRLLQVDHGKTLAKEANTIAKDVLQALISLAQTFIQPDFDTLAANGESGDEYLVKTGVLHDIIDRARSKDGFSNRNLAAVRKVWQRNQASLDDSLDEMLEMMGDAEQSDAGLEGEEFDDGWAELGLPSNVKPSPIELGRIKKVYTIARITILLHQRIFKDMLSTHSPSLSPPKEINVNLDNLASASSEFLASSDDLITTMYPPQAADQISIELDRYHQQITHLQYTIEPFMRKTSVEEELEGLQLSDAQRPSNDFRKKQKWYTVCINQVNKNIVDLQHELKAPEILPA